MGINNPLPSSMASECKKCGKILASFVDPRQAFSPEKVIPPAILANAKGLAILTVIKAGFLGSARFGSGLVIARLPDGSWSAPTAIATGGAGFGGQIGFELTDFVFILNDASAVKTFSQAGSLTLGGNVSIAAGPVGRNAEAAGAASLRSVAGIFSYSKTKGLFAGVSLEGSAIVERKEANAKLYGRPVSARELLTGAERPPPAAAPLLAILNSRAFNGLPPVADTSMYNDIPVYDDSRDDVVWGNGGGGGNSRSGSSYGDNNGGSQRPRDFGGYGNGGGGGGRDRDDDDRFGAPRGHDEFGRPRRAATTSSWQDDQYDVAPSRFGAGSRSSTFNSGDRGGYGDGSNGRREPVSPPGYGGQKSAGPGRPAAPKPNFASKQALLRKNEAVALFNFDGDQPGDLAFRKGDVITVLKKTESDNDWWTGQIGARHGIFPSNYVKMRE